MIIWIENKMEIYAVIVLITKREDDHLVLHLKGFRVRRESDGCE